MLNLVKIIAIKTEHKFQINLSIILVDFILKEKKKNERDHVQMGFKELSHPL